MPSQGNIEAVLRAAQERARACAEANLALRAGLNAFEDARAKLRERLTSLTKDEGSLREGLREGLSVIGHLIALTQSQVPVSEGQLMESRYMQATLSSICGTDSDVPNPVRNNQ